MFFILSKLLYFLILPFSWILVVLIWSVFTKRPRLKSRLQKATIVLILFFSNPWLTHLAIQTLEKEATHLSKNYAVGIVLSGMLVSGIGVPEQIHLNGGADRIIEAVRLYRRGSIEKILISGGKANINFPSENEGKNLVELVTSLGVPETAIILENSSRNTFGNAKYTAELLGDQSGDLLLITSSFHMRRSEACFLKQEMKFDTYPVDFRTPNEFKWTHLIPHAAAFENWNLVIKELVGSIVYKLVGYT